MLIQAVKFSQKAFNIFMGSLYLSILVSLLASCVSETSTRSSNNENTNSKELGQTYYDNKQYRKAFDSWEIAAQKSDVLAQYNLAGLYAEGKGIPQDFQKAAYWYEKAANGENFYSQKKIAEYYEIGRGVTKDLDKALFWYEKAGQSHKDVEVAKKVEQLKHLKKLKALTKERREKNDPIQKLWDKAFSPENIGKPILKTIP